jgi:Xaa-Pro aminopeptidase
MQSSKESSAFILKDENAVFYECGYSCDNALYLHLENRSFFITDGRYAIDAKNSVQGAEVIITRELIERAVEIIAEHRERSLIFNPEEWSVAEYEKLNADGVKLIAVPNYSQKKRMIKTPEEIAYLSKAAQIGAAAFESFQSYLEQEGIGRSEKRLFFEAKRILSNYEERALSFDPIVAINENAALPHAHPTEKVLEHNAIVLFDAGVKFERYCSDRTRMLQGDPTNKKFQEVHAIVARAKEAAIAFIKPGVLAKDIDKIARDIITEAGYGEQFVHSTGHGVGLDIHELPVISAKSDTVIEEGMVFTVEPGIYLEGEFGVRLEDTVVVTHEGATIL